MPKSYDKTYEPNKNNKDENDENNSIIYIFTW
jgi:hypothetical protein